MLKAYAGVVGAVATLFFCSSPQAAIVKVSGLFGVEQEIQYANVNDPNFEIDDGFGNVTYPQFAEYQRIISQEAVVFDQSLIPDTPDGNSPTNFLSNAQLEGAWTFDISVLNTNLTDGGTGELVDRGTFSFADQFEAFFGGESVIAEASTGTRVFTADGFSSDGEVFDVIALGAIVDDGEDQLNLFIANDDQWFERLGDSGVTIDLEDGGLSEGEGVIFGINLESVESGPFRDPSTPLDAPPGAGEVDGPLYEELIGGTNAEPVRFDIFGAADGSTESDPLLPVVIDNPEEGANEGEGPTFGFDLSELLDGEDEPITIFIDPDIAVGYTYEVQDAEITAITAPTLLKVNDADGYIITIEGLDPFVIAPGEKVVLGAPITTFQLTGIDPALMLDPNSGTAFVIGLDLVQAGTDPAVFQTAISVSAQVPLPATAWLMLAGLSLLGGMRHRRRNA